MRAVIFSVVNQKGGVGKTTTAINLASFLAESGHKTLLIDGDPQANASSGVGVRQDRIEKNIYHLIIENEPLESVIYPTAFDNLHLIPSSQDLSGAEIELVEYVSRETILKQRLEPLSNYYKFIIIDCGPSLGLLTINALTASHKAIIPVQCEYFALEGIAHLLDTLNLIKDGLNPDLEIMGIVLTMFDKRNKLSSEVDREARNYFKDKVYQTVIQRNVRLSEAPSHGLPCVIYDKNCVGSKSYLKLAEEFSKKNNIESAA